MKKRISVASMKQKGRRLQKWTAQQISNITGRPCGKDQEIESREMGQSGVDVKLYAKAKEMFPFSVECKNRERWDIPAWILDVKKIQLPGTDWMLVVSKNNVKPIVIMDAEAFFDTYEILVQEIWK